MEARSNQQISWRASRNVAGTRRQIPPVFFQNFNSSAFPAWGLQSATSATIHFTQQWPHEGTSFDSSQNKVYRPDNALLLVLGNL